MYFREHLRVRKLPWQKQSWSRNRARRRAGYVTLVLIPGAAFFHHNGYETCSCNTGRGLHVLISLGFVAPSHVSSCQTSSECSLPCGLSLNCLMLLKVQERGDR